MNKFKRFILSLKFIFMPEYWIMNYKYSPEWDKKLNALLDEYTFVESKTMHNSVVYLGGIAMWVANYPYASFMPFGAKYVGTATFRASRLTILKAHNKYKRDVGKYDTN